MKIAVLSGKGGAGKTFVSVNLAVTLGQATYVDCDVEEPNGHLFLKPENVESTAVNTLIPQFSEELCIGCRRCVHFCHFNALVFIQKKPKVYNDVCHACGGCALVCPAGAVTEISRPVGAVERGTRGNLTVITGKMALGEASATPVIKAALQQGMAKGGDTIIDCPPGSGCAVMESVSQADYCVLVAEPTAFGLHNFAMVHELVRLMHKPCGVVINKEKGEYAPLTAYCREHDLTVLSSFPYSPEIAALNAVAAVACEKSETVKAQFAALLHTIRAEVKA
ncbi:MAG: ATP-binding protein [Eubacteriales bacterium]|nr:ATP-binding protein [Eubacteriales bacterium]